jgi:hypothetical protein
MLMCSFETRSLGIRTQARGGVSFRSIYLFLRPGEQYRFARTLAIAPDGRGRTHSLGMFGALTRRQNGGSGWQRKGAALSAAA